MTEQATTNTTRPLPTCLTLSEPADRSGQSVGSGSSAGALAAGKREPRSSPKRLQVGPAGMRELITRSRH